MTIRVFKIYSLYLLNRKFLAKGSMIHQKTHMEVTKLGVKTSKFLQRIFGIRTDRRL